MCDQVYEEYDLYTGEFIGYRDMNEENRLRKGRILETYNSISKNWILFDHISLSGYTLHDLKKDKTILQRDNSPPRGVVFHSGIPVSRLVNSISRDPFIIDEAHVYTPFGDHIVGNQVFEINTVEQLRDFTLQYQVPTLDITSPLAALRPCNQILYTDLPGLYRVEQIQWSKLQEDGFYGWLIHPSLHNEAMNYAWYHSMYSPMAFVWDIRVFQNIELDLMRIIFE
jgi:hypothetical protein